MGFVKSKEEFIAEVTKHAGSMSVLMEEGETMSTVEVPGPNPKVHIRKFNLATCHKAIQVIIGGRLSCVCTWCTGPHGKQNLCNTHLRESHTTHAHAACVQASWMA